MVFSKPTAPHVSWIPDNFGDYRHLWQFSPLPDTCVLFARKLLPETVDAMDFFTSCSKLGFDRKCIESAHATSRHPDISASSSGQGAPAGQEMGKSAEVAPLPQHVPGFVQRIHNSSL